MNNDNLNVNIRNAENYFHNASENCDALTERLNLENISFFSTNGNIASIVTDLATTCEIYTNKFSSSFRNDSEQVIKIAQNFEKIDKSIGSQE